jgi:hypothetical protein
MKIVYCLPGLVFASLLIGCASTPIALAPVGPNPNGSLTAASMGELQVFSSLVRQHDDQNQAGDGMPGWYQHTDYCIYTPQGKLVKRVGNTTGHYEETPRLVILRPGRYLIKAEARDYSWVQLPVTIERGRTTRVHLDDNWKPAEPAPKNALISMPNGNPVGWRDQANAAFQFN